MYCLACSLEKPAETKVSVFSTAIFINPALISSNFLRAFKLLINAEIKIFRSLFSSLISLYSGSLYVSGAIAS